MARRRRKRRSVRANPVRRRRRRHRARTIILRANPRRRRRRRVFRANRHRRYSRSRRYRRNPSISTGGIVRTLVQGLKDGFTVTLGRGVTNLVASRIPFGQTSPVGQGAVQLGVGIGLSMLVRAVTKSERQAALFLAGATSNVLQRVLAPVPIIGPAVGGVSAYPQFVPRMAAWPQIPAAGGGGVGQPWDYDSPNLSDGIQS